MAGRRLSRTPLRAWVALEHAAYAPASLLDGGLTEWRAAGFADTAGEAGDVGAGEAARDVAGETAGDIAGEAGPDVAGDAGDRGAGDAGDRGAGEAGGGGAEAGRRVVSHAWVSDRLADPAVVLIDARPAAQYRGDEPGERVPRAGHIPGAAHLFWEELTRPGEPGRLRPEPELRARFEAAGVTRERVVVVYCRTGMQASFVYAVARHLGYDADIYDGSFVEWSNRPELPVAR